MIPHIMSNARPALIRGVLLPTVGALLLFGALNITFHINTSGRGMLHPEAEAMLVNYTDGRPFGQKVLDNNYTDWGTFQARELSYVVDYFDYNFVAASIRHGTVHFLSLSN